MEDDNENLYDFCPCCGRDYDEIDYEYQICHLCGYNVEKNAEEEE
jgi:predicted amidophosphoribosyltransferase